MKYAWIPSSYQVATMKLNRRETCSIGHNTQLKALPGPSGVLSAKDLNVPTTIALVYHWTPIVLYHLDGTLTINSGGHRTVTTKARLNAALRRTQYQVVQRERVWYLRDIMTNTEVAYEDGTRLRPLGPRCIGCADGIDWDKVEAEVAS